MRLHVEALYTRDAAGRLLTVNDAGAAPAPRFFFGRTPNGNMWWFRHDVDGAMAEDLAGLCEFQQAGLDVVSAEGFADLLSRAAPIQKIWAGPAYHVPPDLRSEDDRVVRVTADNATVLSPYLEDWQGDVAPNVPMAVALENGKAVSVRLNY